MGRERDMMGLKATGVPWGQEGVYINMWVFFMLEEGDDQKSDHKLYLGATPVASHLVIMGSRTEYPGGGGHNPCCPRFKQTSLETELREFFLIVQFLEK